jgi:hypothetical protein
MRQRELLCTGHEEGTFRDQRHCRYLSSPAKRPGAGRVPLPLLPLLLPRARPTQPRFRFNLLPWEL